MIWLMREIVRLAPELKGRLYLSAGFKVIESLFVSAPYGFLVLSLHHLLSGSLTPRRVMCFSAGLAACFLMQGIFFYLYARLAYPLSTKLCERIRIAVGEHLRKLSMGYFNSRTTGDLNALVSDELVVVGIIPRLAFPLFIVAVTLPAVFAPFLFVIDWRLAAVTLGVVPVSIPFFMRLQKVLRNGLEKRSNALIEISSKIIEYVQGMAVVKAFRQTGQQFSRFNNALKRFKDDNLEMVLRSVPPMMGFRIVLDLGFAMILLAGAFLFLGGEISLLTLLIFLVLGLRVYEIVKSLSAVFELVRVAEVTLQRIRQVLDTSPLPQLAVPRIPNTAGVEFRNVTFAYDKRPVLKNVSFTLPEKAITAFVGPSGAGKTTITHLIARFWDVDSGEIRIGGRNVKEMTTDTLLSRISMVFQDVYLFNDTIYTNIAYGSKNASQDEVIAAAKAAHCHEFIRRLPDGYGTMVGEGGATLSGGEKQRISIARAILKNAPIILLDEATASVDPENEHLIQGAINSLVRSKTLIIIAHRLSTITAADQIIVLDGRGGIEDRGLHGNLLARGGLYRNFWESRQQARSWMIRPSSEYEEETTEMQRKENKL